MNKFFFIRLLIYYSFKVRLCVLLLCMLGPGQHLFVYCIFIQLADVHNLLFMACSLLELYIYIYSSFSEFPLEFDQRLQNQKMIILQEITHLRTHTAGDVILDPDTAHPHLIVSRDGKQVSYGNTQLEGVNGKRFNDYLGVLGKDGFSSGCFYYEVQTKGQTEWDLGVARASVYRMGLTVVSPMIGYWTVSLRDGECWARKSPHVSLPLNVNPQRVGVFVDYEKGLVSFYDVEGMSLMYSYTNQSFDEKLYPFVSLGYLRNENSTPLIICDDYF
uniref:B30.2/SPRY domain-containing protein n=1 Tax=Cyprinus carpio TaxID=7962 RepID=A0A8C1TEQ2_CYPCA